MDPTFHELRVNLESKYKRACLLSIMMDSATDVGVHEVEDSYVCFLKDGEAVSAFCRAQILL